MKCPTYPSDAKDFLRNWKRSTSCRQITSALCLAISSSMRKRLVLHSRAEAGHLTKLSLPVPRAEIERRKWFIFQLHANKTKKTAVKLKYFTHLETKHSIGKPGFAPSPLMSWPSLSTFDLKNDEKFGIQPPFLPASEALRVYFLLCSSSCCCCCCCC
jgi:hypothetical protein